jgi:gluconolactonase
MPESATSLFAEGFSVPEGPVWLPDGSLMVVELGRDRGCITRISNDGRSRSVVARTGRPNGLALDRHGRLWVAETARRAVLCMSLDGGWSVVADRCGDEPFLFPNDVAFAPNGDLYMTDSGIELATFEPDGHPTPAFRDLAYDGRVFRIEPATGRVHRIDRGLMFANGLAFGPDAHLYVAESLTGCIYRYRCIDGVASGPRELFGNVVDPAAPAELKGPDGMKFGADGHLHVAVFGQGDVTVLNPRGKVAQRLRTRGRFPSNLVFARDGQRQIYVTEGETGTVQRIAVATAGYRLHD